MIAGKGKNCTGKIEELEKLGCVKNHPASQIWNIVADFKGLKPKGAYRD